MSGASGCPKPKFFMRKLAVEDNNMTPEDNSTGSTQEVVAAASADIVGCANEDGTAAPAPSSEPAAEVAPAAQQRQGRASLQDWAEPSTN